MLAVLTLLACGASRSTPPETPAPESLATMRLEEISVSLADGTTITADRGRLSVPIVRAESDSKRIEVEVHRFRSTTASSDTPPVFLLHGGPGWPGLGPVLERPGGYEQEIAPLVAMADLVVVGQRGIGSSTDLACDDRAGPPAGERLSLEQAISDVEAASRACRAKWEAEGYDLSGLNVIEAAADVEDARRLLGYDHMTLTGGSFGSHWAMAVLRYHGDHVVRAVLSGTEGPDHTYDRPSGVLDALRNLAAAADAAPELADHVPEGGLLAAFEAVISKAEAAPIVVALEDPESGETRSVQLDADDIRAAATGYTRSVSSRRGAVQWPADIIALHEGDFAGLARARLEEDAFVGMPTASFFMLDCGSGISPERHAAYRADPARAILGDLGLFYDAACPIWGADLGADFRAGFRTDVPTVIVHGTWDVNTPYSNAEEVLPMFSDVTLVTVEGGSHGAMREAMEDPAVRDGLQAFVTTGDASMLPERVVLPPMAWVVPE